MRLLIDGDIIAYAAAASAETPINWGDGLWTLHAYEQDVQIRLEEQIESIVGEHSFDVIQVAISDKDNFRKTICSEYKANRKSIRKPMLLQYAKDYLMAEYDGLIYPTLEADDVLGIEATSDDQCVIWSTDKDLKTITGVHLIDGKLVTIEEAESDYWFYYQALTGDMTDNYSGCPKVGAKTAEKILEEQCDWNAVVKAYLRAGLSEAVALEQARLARILRSWEYNKETGEVTLWTPPNGDI